MQNSNTKNVKTKKTRSRINKWEMAVDTARYRLVKMINIVDSSWQSELEEDDKPYPPELIELICKFAGLETIYNPETVNQITTVDDIHDRFLCYCEELVYYNVRKALLKDKKKIMETQNFGCNHLGEVNTAKDYDTQTKHRVMFKHAGWVFEASTAYNMRVDLTTPRFRTIYHCPVRQIVVKMWNRKDKYFLNSIIKKGYPRHFEENHPGRMPLAWRPE